MIIFDEEHGQSFNAFSYLVKLHGQQAGVTENVIYLLESMSEMAERASGVAESRGDEKFWATSRRELARNAIDLLWLVLGELSPTFILEVVRDAPQSVDEARSEAWQEQSIIWNLLQQADSMLLSEGAKHDLEQVRHYFLQTWPRLAFKTRSIVEASLTGVLDVFSRGKMHRLYCNKITVSPDDILDGKIVVVNQPIKRDQIVGFLSQTLWKTLFQQRVEMRHPGEDRPAFLFIDEAQNLLSLRDQNFIATARSSRVANVWLTQNLPNVFAALGGESKKSHAESILSLAQTKVFHQNSCPITNNWAADLIGQRLTRMRNSSVNLPTYDLFGFEREEEKLNSGSSQSYQYAVQPHVFTSLKKAGRDRRTEAIVFQGGKRFHGSGDNYLRTEFIQGF